MLHFAALDVTVETGKTVHSTAMSISKAILGLFGWKVTGSIDPSLKKFVLIAAPHNSAMDFPLGLLARNVIDRDIKYIGKDSLFKAPFGWLMRALGGYPVDRSKSHNYVQSIVEIFDAKEEFAIALAPEGTRKKVEKFRTGFYFIAKGAGVPIVLVRFDQARKEVHFDPEPFWPTDDSEADIEWIWRYYRDILL